MAAAADRLGVKAQARPICPADSAPEACCPDGTLRYVRNPDGTVTDLGCDDDTWITVALVIAGLVVVGGGVYLLTRKDDSPVVPVGSPN